LICLGFSPGLLRSSADGRIGRPRRPARGAI